MAYSLTNRLVVGVASSALFDLQNSDEVFRQEGEEAYRKFQEANLDVALEPGIAFPFVKRLLSLNDLRAADGGNIVEIIVLSRNDPDTGLRVMRSIAHHHLDITRAVFTQGNPAYVFIPALHISLFLSANRADVRDAIGMQLPAGQVLPSLFVDDTDPEVRIAFDFDGVLADDESEQVMQEQGLEGFHFHEHAHRVEPHNPGPLQRFLLEISKIQKLEESAAEADEFYVRRVRVSIVTARNAPSHERALATLKSWGVIVNDAFFLGGIDKGDVLAILRPHIFFDDQVGHLESTAKVAPSVHIPFGTRNSARLDHAAARTDIANSLQGFGSLSFAVDDGGVQAGESPHDADTSRNDEEAQN